MKWHPLLSNYLRTVPNAIAATTAVMTSLFMAVLLSCFQGGVIAIHPQERNCSENSTPLNTENLTPYCIAIIT